MAVNNSKTAVFVADVGPLSDEALFDRFYRQMPAERRYKIDRLSRAADQRLSLGVGILLQAALRAQGVPQQLQQTACTAGGKDYLPAYPQLHFNLSHSGREAMCIVAEDEAGCDIQRLENVDLRVAARFFSSDEYRLIADEPTESARQQLFFRLWTLKESFIKARGQGLKRPLDSFSVLIGSGGITLEPAAESRDYALFELPAAVGYCAACCLKKYSGPAPQIQRVDLAELAREQDRSGDPCGV